MDHRTSKTVRGTLTATIGAVSIVALAACGTSPAEEDGITHLKMADSYAITHPVGVGGTEPFLEAVEESEDETGLAIDYFASGQLGKQADIPSVVRSGRTDLAVISPAYVSSSFPLSGIGDMSGFGSDSCVTSYALRDLVMPDGILYEEEMEPMNFRPLWTGSIPGYEAMTAGRDPSDPTNLNGTVLRSTGGALDRVIDEMGAAGVAMPIGDLYEALSRGTVEGTLASPISITPYGLEDVITDSTEGAEQGNFTFIYGINLDTWNELTPQQREALEKFGKDSQQSVCENLHASYSDSIQQMKDSGVTFHDASKHREKWEALNEPVLESWVEAGESQGLPAQKVMDEWEKALDRHKDRVIED